MNTYFIVEHFGPYGKPNHYEHVLKYVTEDLDQAMLSFHELKSKPDQIKRKK